MTDRVASHPDDPEAPFADRLLLALGIWPQHVAQVGEQTAIDAACIIRRDAHKFPMAAEDFGNEREQREMFEGICRDLVKEDPRTPRPWDISDGGCRHCPAPGGTDHHDDCLWLRARLATQEECQACGGLGDCARCDGDGCGAEPGNTEGYCVDGTCIRCAGSGIEPVPGDEAEAERRRRSRG